jgi:hypothetical protein
MGLRLEMVLGVFFLLLLYYYSLFFSFFFWSFNIYKFNICHLNAKMELDVGIANLATLHNAIFCNFVVDITFNHIECIQRIMI